MYDNLARLQLSIIPKIQPCSIYAYCGIPIQVTIRTIIIHGTIGPSRRSLGVIMRTKAIFCRVKKNLSLIQGINPRSRL